jgi:1-acyl-sn-glycerol-3-phosphate acyltransferase
MQLESSLISELPPELIRAGLPPWICARLANDAESQARASTALQALMAQTTDAEIQALQQDFKAAGEYYALYTANPLARKVSRIFIGELTKAASLKGLEQLDAFLASPHRKMLVCNHLSYTDTQVTDAVLTAAGRLSVADRLVAVAGPKVYTDTWRRMAAISLNTRKTPQSSAVATELALPPREVAKLALEAIEECGKLMDQGYIILLYPEGTRSKTGQLQSFLRASARYTAFPDTAILPLAQTGTEQVFPRDTDMMYVAPVKLTFGTMIPPHIGKTENLERSWNALAGLLPPDYQPAPLTMPIV